MFLKNSIGEKINDVLVTHGKENLFKCSFEEAVNNSCKLLKTLMNLPVKDDTLNDIYNSCTGDYELTEDWIHCIHFYMNYKVQGEELKIFDSYVYWLVNLAIFYYDERIWRKYFTNIHTDNNHIAYRNEENETKVV